ALTGTDFTATVAAADQGSVASSVAVVPGYAVGIRAGDVLTLSRPLIPGARCYLAVAGGFDVPLVLGSRSTDLGAGFGGLSGRALMAGDRLSTGIANGKCISSR